MKRFFLLALIIMAALTAWAIPAKRGVERAMLQPDGTTVHLTIHGDEHSPYYMTQDGIAVIGCDDGYFYATVDPNGNAAKSAMLAHDIDCRKTAESQMLATLDGDAVHKAIIKNKSGRRNATHSGVGTSSPDYPTKGEQKGVVFLVEYADVKFNIDDPYDYFNRLLNEDGFSLYGGTGSCRNYFIDSSNGLFTPHFDVYGPVTLPENRAFYGGNTSYGADKQPQYMMLHAAQALDSEVDFSQYDLDADGFIDSVFIFYAGEGEAGGGGADSVWPHAWQYTFNQRFDGVRLSRYACGPEMEDNKPDGVGTFCHEFAHVLGLPDLYNTEDPSTNYTPLNWSVLDQGCYNNDSRTPPAFSAFERNALGWMDDLLYEPTDPGEYTLRSLAAGNKAILLPTEKQTEFFLLENRQQEGWDKYLPYHGMLVWHIDFSLSAWWNNSVNVREDHQMVDIVEACGRPYASYGGSKRYPFPGSGGATELRFGGTPSLEDWYGNDLGYDIVNIKEHDGIITFDIDDRASISDIAAERGWQLTGRTVAIGAKQATVTDISGRIILSGNDIERTLPVGVYIISDGTPASKILIK